jgi:hypothetical protein
MTIAANFSCYVGEDVSLPVTIYQADNATPEDITGWSSVSFIVHAIGSTTALITKTVGNGIVLTTPLSGLLTITVAAADTVNLAANQYLFRIERTDLGSDAVLTEGFFTLLGK